MIASIRLALPDEAIPILKVAGGRPGAADLVNTGPLSGANATVTLPTNGATIYVQLETHLGGTILENNNTYIEAP
jgi:hypothetical protein